MNTETVIALITIILGSNWLGNILLEMYKNKRARKTPMEEMVLALGKDKLLHLSKNYLRKGGIPEDDYEVFIAVGEAYLGMQGNSKVKKRYLEAKELPILDEGAKKNEQ